MNIQRKKNVFIGVFCVWYLLAWSYCLFFNSGTVSTYFIDRAFFSDFYSPLAKDISNAYMSPFFSNYPPLANLFFILLKRFTNVSVDGELVTPNSLLFVCYGIFLLISIAIILICFSHELNKVSKNISNYVIPVLLLLSGPFLFLCQRGNILFIVISFIGVFLFNYESESIVWREIAIICLSLAIALKIYPVIFLLLLLRKKHWKQLIHTIIYTAILYLIPFGVYGYRSIFLFVQNLFLRDSSINNVLNHAIAFNGMIKILSGLLWGHIIADPSSVILICVCLMLLYIFATSGYTWMQLSALTLIMIWAFNGSYLYNACFMVFPFIYFINDTSKRKIDIVYLLLFCSIFSINFFPEMTYLNRLLQIYSLGEIAWNLLITQISLFVFFLVMFFDNLNNRKKEAAINAI